MPTCLWCGGVVVVQLIGCMLSNGGIINGCFIDGPKETEVYEAWFG